VIELSRNHFLDRFALRFGFDSAQTPDQRTKLEIGTSTALSDQNQNLEIRTWKLEITTSTALSDQNLEIIN